MMTEEERGLIEKARNYDMVSETIHHKMPDLQRYYLDKAEEIRKRLRPELRHLTYRT